MVYTKFDKENQRDTWAGFNKIFGVVAMIIFLIALLGGLWFGVDTAWFWAKLAITLSVLVLISAVVYALIYDVFIEWLTSDVYDD